MGDLGNWVSVGNSKLVYTREEIHDEICKFVTDHPGRNINQVVEHIYKPENKNMCAKQTAENRVRELIGTRLVDNQKRDGAFHSLYINDENPFNLVDKELTEIEVSIGMMSKSMEKIRQLHFHELYLGRQVYMDLRNHFEAPYRFSFNKIFLYLYDWITTRIHSDDELKILYRRILELMIRVDQQTFIKEEIKDDLSPLVHRLEELRNLSNVKAFAKTNSINTKVANNIIATINNFQKRFLD